MFLHDPNALSRTVPRDSLKQTTPAILIGRLHSYDFRSNCIVNHDLTLCSRLHVTQHFETICANWYYHKSTRFRQPNDGKGKYPQQNPGKTIVIRGDWLWKAANINDKNNSAAVYVQSTVKVHNPLFSVGKLLRNKLMQRFYWSIQSKW